MRAYRLAALFALALALAPAHALAQVPTQPQGCAIAADPPTVPATLAADAVGDVALNVRNTGSFPADVNVSAVLNDAGWRIVSGPADQAIAAGGSGSFVFRVSPATGAAPTATIQLTVNAACNPPTGPLPTACPGNSCQATASQQGALAYEAPQGIRLPGLDALAFPIEYLIAGVLLVAVATAIPLALRGRTARRGGIAADCPEPLKMLKAGRGTSFPIELRNLADQPAQASFEVAPVPEGWSAFMPLPEVQLAAKEARSLWLMVRAPPDAQVGATADIELKLRLPSGVELPSVRVRAEVNEV